MEQATTQISLKKNILFIATAIATTAYLLWRTIFTLPFSHSVVSIFCGLVLLLCEIIAGFESLEQYLNMVNMKDPELPLIPQHWYPDVDILVVTHNEDRDLVYKTVNACNYLNYPDKNKIHIFICDDTNRPEIKSLAEELGVGYFGLSNNIHAKAGNMNNALAFTNSPLIATFDADMIPRSNFLMEMVPYFFLPKIKKNKQGAWLELGRDEIDPNYKIGFVQAPQSFYNPDLFQYNLYSETRVPNEQDYFFREINVGRNRSNSSLFVGSNAIFSREALEEVGGIAINTITEDFETGIRIQSKGYRSYAISKPLAHGLAPHTISSLISQRERWARGCIQSLHNVRPFFKSKLGIGAKISYFACAVYWWTFTRRFVYISSPILAVIFNMHLVDCTLSQLLVFWLPHYILSSQSLKILSGSTRNQHWNNLIDTILFPYIIIPVILESFGFRKNKFVVTSKKKNSQQASPEFFAMPHIFLLIFSLFALVLCVFNIIASLTLYNFILIFWLVVNSKNLIFAIFFMLGRDNFRKADRFYVNLPVTVECEGKNYSGITTDISETGISLRLSFPVYLSDEKRIGVLIRHDKYQANMLCKVVHVDQPRRKSEGWRYCLIITDIDAKNMSLYCQVVFDRIHTLPQSISNTFTVYDDFKYNIEKRFIPAYEVAMRKLPRIHLDIESSSANGAKYIIHDFNYKYAFIKQGPESLEDELELQIGDKIKFKLQAVQSFNINRADGRLYDVVNLDELLASEDFEKALKQWVAEKN